jgi:exopolysaccharide biosynthesis polyprenyl glycosylphosphotransferase
MALRLGSNPPLSPFDKGGRRGISSFPPLTKGDEEGFLWGLGEMNREAFFARLLMAGDGAALAGAFALAYHLRKLMEAPGLRPLGPIEHYLWILLIAIPCWWTLLFLDGAYKPDAESPERIVKRAIKAGLMALLFLSFFLFLIKFETFNRTLLIFFVLVATALLALFRLGLSWWISYRRRRGKNLRHALVVVSNDATSIERASSLIERMRASDVDGTKPVACVTLGATGPDRAVSGIGIRGAVEELPNLLHEEVIDEVYFFVDPSSLSEIRDYLKLCEEMGVEVKVLAQLYQPALARPYLEERFGLPFFSLSAPPAQLGRRYLKEFIDFLGAFTLLVLFSIPMIAVATLIRLSSNGPVLFRQQRSGLHGRRFTLYKFRTMVPQAEELKEELRNQNEMSGPVFKIKDDPRATPLGRWLRRTSLDELPQFFNVLRGEMSLVGPRPLPLAEAAAIKGA